MCVCVQPDVFTYLFTYLAIYPPTHLSLSLYIYAAVHRSDIFTYLSAYLPIYLSLTYPPLSLYIYKYSREAAQRELSLLGCAPVIYPPICLPFYLSTYLSTYLPISLSIYVHTHTHIYIYI